eukprot:Opistho-2@61523
MSSPHTTATVECGCHDNDDDDVWAASSFRFLQPAPARTGTLPSRQSRFDLVSPSVAVKVRGNPTRNPTRRPRPPRDRTKPSRRKRDVALSAAGQPIAAHHVPNEVTADKALRHGVLSALLADAECESAVVGDEGRWVVADLSQSSSGAAKRRKTEGGGPCNDPDAANDVTCTAPLAATPLSPSNAAPTVGPVTCAKRLSQRTLAESLADALRTRGTGRAARVNSNPNSMEASYCPNCQAPLRTGIASAIELHVFKCFDVEISNVECEMGVDCTVADMDHFRRRRHSELALIRSMGGGVSIEVYMETGDSMNARVAETVTVTATGTHVTTESPMDTSRPELLNAPTSSSPTAHSCGGAPIQRLLSPHRSPQCPGQPLSTPDSGVCVSPDVPSHETCFLVACRRCHVRRR